MTYSSEERGRDDGDGEGDLGEISDSSKSVTCELSAVISSVIGDVLDG